MQDSCKNFLYSFELQRDRIISKRKLQHQNHINSYVNPIKQAKAYQEVMQEENLNQNQLAKKLGISRVRVNQVLNLLKLPEDQQKYVLEHGKKEMITERQLRKGLSI